MDNANYQVRKLLSGDTSIQKDLSRGIINVRALAKFIIKNYSIEASLDSVISAIRRYQTEGKFEEDTKALSSIFKKSAISTRSNVIAVTLSKHEAQKSMSKFFLLEGPYKTITGDKFIKIMVDKKGLQDIFAIFTKKSISELKENLTEFSISIPEEAWARKGLMAKLANELALENINIEEMITCLPDIIIYVKEEDTLKAHQSLLKLKE